MTDYTALASLLRQRSRVLVFDEKTLDIEAQAAEAIEKLVIALRAIAELPIKEQDNMPGTNMRRIAREILGEPELATGGDRGEDA